MMIREILACLLLLGALAVFCISVLGMYRFDYVLNRMHAAGMSDSLGLLLTVAAGCLFFWEVFPILKLVFLLITQWAMAPVASHLIARVEILTNRHLDEHLNENAPSAQNGKPE